MTRLRQFLPYAGLGATGLVFFWSIISGQRFMWEDMIHLYYPYNYFLFGALRELSLPLWNPYVFSGMPFLADVQSQVFYPLNWMLALLHSGVQSQVFLLVELKAILHVLLGGVFGYLLLRELRVGRTAAFFSGMVFMLSGFVVFHLMHLTLVNAYVWFPLITLLLLRVLEQRRFLDSLLLALVTGLANLAGHPQVTLHMMSAAAVVLILHLAFNWKEERGFVLRSHLPNLAAALALGFALSAVAFVPAFYHSRYTERETMTFALSATGSLPPYFPLLMAVPKFFGSITGMGTDSVAYWGPAHIYWETCIYLGVLPLVLALFGVFFSRVRARLLFLILGLGSFLAALGSYTPFYRFIFEFVPGFDRFRIPARFAGIGTLCIVVLAGLGMEAFIKGEAGRKGMGRFLRGLVIATCVVLLCWLLLAFGALRGANEHFRIPGYYANSVRQSGLFLVTLLLVTAGFWLRARSYGTKGKTAAQPWLPPLLLLLTFVDLYVAGHGFNTSRYGPEAYFRSSATVASLRRERSQEVFRINARAGSQMVLGRNEGMVQRLELIEGYTPLKLADYISFEIEPGRKHDLLNAKYRIAVDEERKTMQLVPNPTYLSRARMVYDYVVEKDRQRILGILNDQNFDYRNRVVLEKEPGFSPPGAQDSVLSTPRNRVRIVDHKDSRIRLEAETETAGLLVLSEVYYPEWRAFVDGQEVEILRADYCLRAIPLEPGSHEVVTYYDSRNVRNGAIVSALALVVCIAGFLLGAKPWKRKPRARA